MTTKAPVNIGNLIYSRPDLHSDALVWQARG